MKELSENGLLRVKESTVRRSSLEDFLRKSECPVTLAGQLAAFLRVPDNVLAIAQNRDVLHRLDAAFFQVGEARDGLLVKFYGGEDISEDELIERFEERGLAFGRLRHEGRLLMRAEEIPVGERSDQLGRLIEESGGGSSVWASFD